MTQLPKILLILLILTLIGNLLFLDYSLFLKKTDISDPGSLEQAQTSPEVISDLGSEELSDPGSLALREIIAEEVSRAVATISGKEIVTEKTTEKIVEKVTQPTSAPQTLYLPLGSGGSTTATSWVDVAGSEFVFDLADYGTNTKVYWQGNLKAEHANSRCYARIYDSSNNRTVDFSEQTTDQTSFQTLTSLRLSIWQGKNNYRLQAKSLNGITCSLESPRLIIISQ